MSLEYVIRGGAVLKGTVDISGSKNAALPVMAAALLTDESCKIKNIPALSDTKNMAELLKYIGADVNSSGETVDISAKRLNEDISDFEGFNRLRASFLVIGPILARMGRVKISMPGGCAIGSRPIDLHLKALTSLGAAINGEHGYIEAVCNKLKGNKIYLDFPSVGATETAIMAASLARGETIVENAAAEPEIKDLAYFINAMGGNVEGAGTDTVHIYGVDKLHKAKHNVIPDRIEAGTFLTSIAVTGGRGRINKVIPDHLKPITAKLSECGIDIEAGEDFIDIDALRKPRATDIKTMPYPGFPTDLQAPFTAMMTVSEGTSMIVETVFENRFMHIPELVRMGANAKIEGKTAVVEGVASLTGAKVHATDLRAGAALVIAGLCAKGTTEIADIYHIDRGYCDFENKLRQLGADIKTTET